MQKSKAYGQLYCFKYAKYGIRMAPILLLYQKRYQMPQNRYFCTKYFTNSVLNHI